MRRNSATAAFFAPLSVRASKQAAMAGLDAATLEEASNGRYEAVHTLFRSDDFKEGPRAFAEKRNPVWKGR